MVESVSMNKHIEAREALRKYLTSEELWLRDVQRERGGQVFIETLGEKMVMALAVVIQGGNAETVNRGLALFNMIFGMIREYVAEIRSETGGLESYLEGMEMAMLDDVYREDVEGDSIRESGFDMAIDLYNAIGGVEQAMGRLQDWAAKIETVEEVHLRKFMSGIKNELVRRGILEDEKQGTI